MPIYFPLPLIYNGTASENSMKIVNAVWEKRNLGVDTVEITFEKKDSEKEVEDFLMAMVARGARNHRRHKTC